MTTTFDYSVLEPGLAVSAYPLGSELSTLPYEAVLNVCDFEEPAYGHQLARDTRLVRRPFEDLWPVPFPWLVTAVLELANLRGQGISTLVHCHAGQHRSPTVIALYWMARDGIDWEFAVRKLFEIRPIAHPGRSEGTLFAHETARETVVAITREFLGGNHELLDRYRGQADALNEAYNRRMPDPAPNDADWNSIDDASAIGLSMNAWPNLAANGFDCILVLKAYRDADYGGSVPPDVSTLFLDFPVQDGINASVLAAAVQQLDLWRRQGRRVFLLGPEQDFFAVVTLCIWLLQTRHWDAASSIWYVASRRPRICLYLDILLELDLERLAAHVARCSHSPVS